MTKILITGTAGFIGFHTAKHLLERGGEIVGLDNINDYYDQRIKYGRLQVTGIDKEEIIYAEFDLEENAKQREYWGLLKDRRPSCYTDLV